MFIWISLIAITILVLIFLVWYLRYQHNWILRAEEKLAEIELETSALSARENILPKINLRLINLNELFLQIIQKAFKSNQSLRQVLHQNPDCFNQTQISNIFWAQEICRQLKEGNLEGLHDQQIAEACEIMQIECERLLRDQPFIRQDKV
jgi:GTPase SAR1 family protein